MSNSSILGADTAPSRPSGRDADLLGPSDNSDSGSDAVGTAEAQEDSDSAGTGVRGAAVGKDEREGGDIMPDHVVNLADGDDSQDADPDGMDISDLDDDEAQALADRAEDGLRSGLGFPISP